ncbi:hypothetical protein OPV22_034656 [Ensete ventricosum]|uniref:Uncharacterized protein n=1 Tax=Ensete ventricosum TaxID=4639 RepID=A0AAV8Q3F4_ENSVE|nr:hypothetical protein OPV22_034656 [Ensete ventricosum]
MTAGEASGREARLLAANLIDVLRGPCVGAAASRVRLHNLKLHTPLPSDVKHDRGDRKDSWPFPFLEITHTAHAEAGDWRTRREGSEESLSGFYHHYQRNFTAIEVVLVMKMMEVTSSVRFTHRAPTSPFCLPSPNRSPAHPASLPYKFAGSVDSAQRKKRGAWKQVKSVWMRII